MRIVESVLDEMNQLTRSGCLISERIGLSIPLNSVTMVATFGFHLQTTRSPCSVDTTMQRYFGMYSMSVITFSFSSNRLWQLKQQEPSFRAYTLASLTDQAKSKLCSLSIYKPLSHIEHPSNLLNHFSSIVRRIPSGSSLCYYLMSVAPEYLNSQKNTPATPAAMSVSISSPLLSIVVVNSHC